MTTQIKDKEFEFGGVWYRATVRQDGECIAEERDDGNGWIPVHLGDDELSEHFTKLFLEMDVNPTQHIAASNLKTCLELSVSHMPDPCPDFGDLVLLGAYDEGFVIAYDYTEPEDCRIPEWLEAIVELAEAARCSMIIFDSDAEAIPGLPVYQWATPALVLDADAVKDVVMEDIESSATEPVIIMGSDADFSLELDEAQARLMVRGKAQTLSFPYGQRQRDELDQLWRGGRMRAQVALRLQHERQMQAALEVALGGAHLDAYVDFDRTDDRDEYARIREERLEQRIAQITPLVEGLHVPQMLKVISTLSGSDPGNITVEYIGAFEGDPETDGPWKVSVSMLRPPPDRRFKLALCSASGHGTTVAEAVAVVLRDIQGCIHQGYQLAGPTDEAARKRLRELMGKVD